MTASIPFVDVDVKSDLPAAPRGQRWLEFLGGERNLRCYLVDRGLQRSEFMRVHADLLDEALHPVYSAGGVVVRQDCSWAVPGFYIVSPEVAYPALDLMPCELFATMASVIRDVRAAMRRKLGIQHIHLHYEEKDEESCAVHVWLLPIPSVQGEQNMLLTHIDIHGYLRGFRFVDTRRKIVDGNVVMREVLSGPPGPPYEVDPRPGQIEAPSARPTAI